jgi:virginiamycin B lyase
MVRGFLAGLLCSIGDARCKRQRAMLSVELLERRELLSTGLVTLYSLNGSAPNVVTKGPDGNLWFTENLSDRIGTIDSTGKITEFASGLGTLGAITLGPDGNLWFTVVSANEIGKMTPAGKFTTYAVSGGRTAEIISGPDGNIWFTFENGNLFGKVTPGGVVSYYSLSQYPFAPTSGPDGSIWFIALDAVDFNAFNVAKFNPADGSVVVFPLPHGARAPGVGGISSITIGPDGNVYAADGYENRLIQLTPAGSVTDIQLPDGALPASLGSGKDGAIWYEVEGTSSGSGTDQLGRYDTKGTVSQYVNLGVALVPVSFASDSAGNLWTSGVLQGGSSVLVKVAVSALQNPTVTLVNTGIGSVVQGVLSNATVSDGASVTVEWQGGQLTPAVVIPRDLNSFYVEVPRVFAATGTISAQVVITQGNGVRTVLGTSFSVVPSPNGQFLTNIYRDLLGRGVDPSGSQSWLGLLQQGASRQQVVRGIQQSHEYQTRVIDQLYEQLLLRAPDPGGLTGFSNFMALGGTQAQVEARILGSREYFQRNGGTNSQLVDALYRDVLERAVDPGAAGWVNLLNNGGSASDVALRVLSSDEGLRLEVQSLYQLYLHRSPDDGGLAAFTQFLKRGGTEEQAIESLLSSPEYFNMS